MVLVAVSLVIGPVGGTALTPQDTTTEGEGGLPGRDSQQNCGKAGASVVTLVSVSGDALSDDPDTTHIPTEESEHSEVIGRSQFSVDVNLDDMLAGDHAVIIHESADSMDVFVAGGAIVAEADAERSLIMELEDLGDSCVIGQAVVESDDDGTIRVTVAIADADNDWMTPPEG